MPCAFAPGSGALRRSRSGSAPCPLLDHLLCLRFQLLQPIRGERPFGHLLAQHGLCIDLDLHDWLLPASIALTPNEFKLLAVLARHPNRAFSRLQLIEMALGDLYEGFERTVDSHISHLRAKLGDDSLIQTVKGVGFKLVPPGR